MTTTTHALPERTTAAHSPYRNVLLLRTIFMDLVVVCALLFAWQRGWISAVLTVDSGIHLVKANTVIFLFGMITVYMRTFAMNRELDAIYHEDAKSPTKVGTFLRDIKGSTELAFALAGGRLNDALTHRNRIVRDFTQTVLFVGILGTTIVMFIALYYSIDQNQIADAAAIPGMVAGALKNIGVAVVKTSCGGIYYLILIFHYRMLDTALAHVMDDARDLKRFKRARGVE